VCTKHHVNVLKPHSQTGLHVFVFNGAKAVEKERAAGNGREAERERESKPGLGNPSGNLKPSPLGGVSRSDDLSKIRTSIVRLVSQSDSLSPSPLISRHRPSLIATVDSTPETKSPAGTRKHPPLHFPLDVSITSMCFESDRPGPSSLSPHATAATRLITYVMIYLSMHVFVLSV